MTISDISQVRALRKKIVVFSMPIRRKTKSGLYIYNTRRDALFHAEDIWIVSVGPSVRETIRPGQKGLISDGMELELSDLDMWEALKDNPLFAELKALQDEVDGEVRTQIITEDSLIAVYE